MKQYIDKDIIMVEIESLLDKSKYHEEYDCAYRDGNNGALYALKSKLDALKVKEIDLEKEIDECMKQYHMLAVGRKDFSEIAKYFLELGLTIRKENSSNVQN